MSERITGEDFRRAEGVGDWEVAGEEARAVFRTGSFSAGVALVDSIGVLADAANHHPDVDLRYPSVTVTLTTHDAGGLTELDVRLAREISRAARDLGVSADRS